MSRTLLTRAVTTVTSVAMIATATPALVHAQNNDAVTAEQPATDIHHTAGKGSTDSNSSDSTSSGSSKVDSMKVSDSSSRSEGWFDRQTSTVQNILIALGVMGIVGLVLGPLRVVFFNLFKL